MLFVVQVCLEKLFVYNLLIYFLLTKCNIFSDFSTPLAKGLIFFEVYSA